MKLTQNRSGIASEFLMNVTMQMMEREVKTNYFPKE